MTSTVPYLIRAINEWILDNNCTPYLIVDVNMSGVAVPMAETNLGAHNVFRCQVGRMPDYPTLDFRMGCHDRIASDKVVFEDSEPCGVQQR